MNINRKLKDILCCPTCREKFVYEKDSIYCPNCKKEALVEGRLLDFSHMTPELPLDFAKYTQKLHEYAGRVMKDIKPDYRVESVMKMVKQKALGNTCLEIGGGDGVMTTGLEKLFNNVLTTDFSKNFLKRIESKTSNTLCLYNDAHFLPIQDETIDTIICSEVLEHVSIPTQLLSEIRRVMKKEGVCILSVPNEAKMSFHRYRAKTKYFTASDSHVTFYNPDTLNKLLYRMGLEVMEIKTLNSARLSLKAIIRNPLTFLIDQITGRYILCLLKTMDNPKIYWEILESRIKQ